MIRQKPFAALLHTMEKGGGEMEILTAFFLAGGIFLVLWCVFGLLLLPAAMENFVTVWHLCGEAPSLEKRVRSLRWLQRTGFFPSCILLVDCGLSFDARKRAELLARNEIGIHLVSQQDFFTYFDFTRADHGTGI